MKKKITILLNIYRIFSFEYAKYLFEYIIKMFATIDMSYVIFRVVLYEGNAGFKSEKSMWKNVRIVHFDPRIQSGWPFQTNGILKTSSDRTFRYCMEFVIDSGHILCIVEHGLVLILPRMIYFQCGLLDFQTKFRAIQWEYFYRFIYYNFEVVAYKVIC